MTKESSTSKSSSSNSESDSSSSCSTSSTEKSYSKDSNSSEYIEPLTYQEVADILEKNRFGKSNKKQGNQPPCSKRHIQHKKITVKKLESASSWETVCSLRDEIFS